MPEPAAAVTAGLLTREAEPVPLTGVSIDASVSTFCGRVTITQRYVNRESHPIEAVYVFPLDEAAAVCGFEAIIDGTLVIGEVKEREQAFREYDDALERGDGAYLLDEERPDVFQASIGNLPPGKEVLVKLTYVTELGLEGRAVRFAIPTTVSPRYAPAEHRTGVGRPDAEVLNPPAAWRVPYGLDLSVRLSMPGAIASVSSPSHPVTVSISGQEATVSLAQRDAALDRDFVLVIDAAGLETPHAWLERDDEGNSAIAVAFVPAFDAASTPSEVIFLVDRSGSMAGASIDEVRNALQLCLRSMLPGCRFNIVGFGSTFEALFPESRPYDESSLAAASAHVAVLDASLGGTEILPALEFVLAPRPDRALPRQVVVLTDGEVSNTDAVLAIARQHAASARVFTFGIGAGASHHLVRGLARAGGGSAEFIYPGERIEPKVIRQFGRLLSPAVTDVRVEWGGLDVTQAPSSPPPVFASGRLLVYGFVRGNVKAATIRLAATSPSGSLAFDVPLDPERVTVGRTITTLAARARIRELEESPEWTTARGSRQRGRVESKVKGEIVELATRYGLASRETSFVAIERRETPLQGDLQLRRVPIALTTGWGGLDRLAAAGATLASSLTVPFAAPMHTGLFRESGDTAMPVMRAARPASRLRDMWRRKPAHYPVVPSAPMESTSAPAAPDTTIARMHRLVALQRADGSWDLTSELADVVGRPFAQLASAMPTAGRGRDVSRAWATALALAWLRTEAAAFEDQWRLLAEKGRRWLEREVAAAEVRDAYLDAATQCLRT